MLASPLLEALQSLLSSPSPSRELGPDEVLQLEKQGNRFVSGCVVSAGPGFQTGSFHHNRFQGRVVLSGQVERSVLEDVSIGEGAQIDQCPLVRRTHVGAGALLRNSNVDCSGPTRFGVGTVIKAGLETPGREIRIWDAMTLAEGERYLSDRGLQAQVAELEKAIESSVSVVGARASLVNALWVDRAYLGPGTKIHGAQRVESCALVCNEEEPITLGSGVQVQDSILQWGVVVETAAQVSRSILLEYSGACRQALVTQSLIGPNSTVGGGELTASFLGPFVGFHHQSLLIAAWWPEGRGNVGYGANIGSNHTSRSPDQELWAGEGTFFGLATAVKFPSNFQDAPYSILASGVVTLPQKLSLPFSLILDEPLDTPETRGLNRVIPGWVLKENVYLLLRNEAKYFQRNRARRHRFDLRIFRPDIVEKLWKARVLLVNIEGKAVYTKADLPALGKNYMIEEDRIEALATYREFLKFAALKLFAENVLDQVLVEGDWLNGLFRRLNLDYFSTAQNLGLYLAEEQKLFESSLRSKDRDDRRGAAIIPDYLTFHGPAEEDDFLLSKKADLARLKVKISQFQASVP